MSIESKPEFTRRQFLTSLGLITGASTLLGLESLFKTGYEYNLDKTKPVDIDPLNTTCHLTLLNASFDLYSPNNPEEDLILRKIASMDESNNWFTPSLIWEQITLPWKESTLGKMNRDNTEAEKLKYLTNMTHMVQKIIFRKNKFIALCNGPLPEPETHLPAHIRRIDNDPNRISVQPQHYLIVTDIDEINKLIFRTINQIPGNDGFKNIMSNIANSEQNRLEPNHCIAMPSKHHPLFTEHMKSESNLQRAIILAQGIEGPNNDQSRQIVAASLDLKSKITVPTGTELEIRELVNIQDMIFAIVVDKSKDDNAPNRTLIVNPADLVFPPRKEFESDQKTRLQSIYEQNNQEEATPTPEADYPLKTSPIEPTSQSSATPTPTPSPVEQVPQQSATQSPELFLTERAKTPTVSPIIIPAQRGPTDKQITTFLERAVKTILGTGSAYLVIKKVWDKVTDIAPLPRKAKLQKAKKTKKIT